MDFESADHIYMQRALELAAQGEGYVEPNPMVGCVIVADGQIVGEGYHAVFGGPHAEVQAIESAGGTARGATMYVTLEPCCHHGKTPPCTQAIQAAGIARVVLATTDPFPAVDGGGIDMLRQAGIDVRAGLLAAEAAELIAPYLKLVKTGRPWVIAKWAMTLDGKLATQTGDSRWISNEVSRAVVHKLRGRADAVLIGRGTAETDDPLLTARPAGPRTAARIVVDSQAALSLDSQLVRSAKDAPVIVAASEKAPVESVDDLSSAGCEVLRLAGDQAARLAALLEELGRRKMTNLLVEGGAQIFGSLFGARLVDEAHVFIAPKIVGGRATTPVGGGKGVELMQDAMGLRRIQIRELQGDVYLSGRLNLPAI